MNPLRNDTTPGPGHTDLTGLRTADQWDTHPGVRSGVRLSAAERAADFVARTAGTWTYLAIVVIAVSVGAAVALARDGTAGAVAVLSVVLSGAALVEVTFVLMLGRRADRRSQELAGHDLEQARRTAAIAQELRSDIQDLHADLAAMAARVDRATYLARRASTGSAEAPDRATAQDHRADP